MAGLDDAASELESIARHLREIGDTELLRELTRRMRDAVDGVPDQVRAGLPDHLPRRYAATLDADLRIGISVRTTGAEPGREPDRHPRASRPGSCAVSTPGCSPIRCSATGRYGGRRRRSSRTGSPAPLRTPPPGSVPGSTRPCKTSKRRPPGEDPDIKVTIDGEPFDYDGKKAPMSECLAVEKAYGRRYAQWQEDLAAGSAEAMCVLAWIIWRRDGRDTAYQDILDGKADFDLLEMLNSISRVRGGGGGGGAGPSDFSRHPGPGWHGYDRDRYVGLFCERLHIRPWEIERLDVQDFEALIDYLEETARGAD